ncbi:glycosyltransferase family 9 protein [Tolumonas osonensis]|uniref:Heptosyltransferase I n=1 Tax=Tolumonas osonensis TaxID=675874 RepID=A0A841GCN4_9GAMM|nr:glycosyltransferase family 9 protein [Tolumonas osonensis]MBB6056914.1 heptosyltransferase I [Tolumonas osonensis]
MPLFLRAPEALCLIRLSAIGDCVHAVAMVQAIQRQWPQTKITWIMGKAEASLLHDLPGVEVIIFDKAAGLRAYTSIWQQLRHRRFDALLHMQSALRASLLSLGIKAGKTLGFDQQRAGDGQSLFTNHKVPSPQSPHVLDGFMAFAAELGVHDLTPQWHIPITEADHAWAKQTVSGEKPTLLIAPSASKAYKNWTQEGYAALADHAATQGFHVILCGGPALQEKQFAEAISALCQHKPVNLVGQTTLKRLLALIQQATVVLAPDTGPAHMATAVGTPVIGLYAHHNPERTGPYFCRAYIVSVYQTLIEAQTGKPMAQLAWRTRLKQADAMQHIRIADVKQRFDEVAAKIKESRSHE